MLNKGFVPSPDQSFVFVDASANIPTHALRIFQEDQKERKKKGGASIFLVGDLIARDLEIGKEMRVKMRSEMNFLYVEWKAHQMPIKRKSVNMIWDRLGCLWHVASDICLGEFLSTIDHYREILKEGGCFLVDDAIFGDNSSNQYYLESFALQPSTVQKIETMHGNSGYQSMLSEICQRGFETFSIGEDNRKMMVFKKL